MASVAVSGPTVSTVTSPPWASLTVSASSRAYSSISLMTLSAVARATVLSCGSSFRSLPESGTCLTRTTMFIVRPTSAVVHGGAGDARLAADHRGYPPVTPAVHGGARPRRPPLPRPDEVLQRAGVRRQVQTLAGDPRVVVVRVGVTLTAVAEQRDHAAGAPLRSHLGDQPEGTPQVGAGRATGTPTG